MKNDLTDKWISGEFEGSEEDFEDLINDDERIKNLVFEKQKENTVTLDRRCKHSQGVAEIANGVKYPSSVDELGDI